MSESCICTRACMMQFLYTIAYTVLCTYMALNCNNTYVYMYVVDSLMYEVCLSCPVLTYVVTINI